MVVIVGTNYKFSPLYIREKIFISAHKIKEALNFLYLRRNALEGVLVLSTCNRTEVYASGSDNLAMVKELKEFFTVYYELNPTYILPYLYIYEEEKAIEHLLRVAAGLDSLIVGETEILGQLRLAFIEADRNCTLDRQLYYIFQRAITVAKKIHTYTSLGRRKVSVGSVAVDFVRRYLGSIKDKKILILGMGEVTELVLKYLIKHNPKIIFIANRTLQKAKDWAEKLRAEAVAWDKFKEYLEIADAVVTATASRKFIVKYDEVKGIIGQRREKKLLILDLAIPRDVDPRIKELANVDVFYLEDLKSIIKENEAYRRKEITEAERFIYEEMERLKKKEGWLKRGLLR